MLFNKLHISNDATSRLRSLRQRTGLTPNLLCRLGLMLSLEEGSVGTSKAPDEDGQEFNAYTLMGDHEALINALLRLVEDEDESASDDELLDRLKSHLHRGVARLAVRVRAPVGVAQLISATVAVSR